MINWNSELRTQLTGWPVWRCLAIDSDNCYPDLRLGQVSRYCTSAANEMALRALLLIGSD